MSRVQKTRACAVIVVLGLLSLSGPVVFARAQPPAAAQGTAQEAADQYVPVKSLPQQDALPAAPLVIAAYSVVWVVLLVYVWSIWRRLMKVEQEIQSLASRVADAAPRR